MSFLKEGFRLFTGIDLGDPEPFDLEPPKDVGEKYFVYAATIGPIVGNILLRPSAQFISQTLDFSIPFSLYFGARSAFGEHPFFKSPAGALLSFASASLCNKILLDLLQGRALNWTDLAYTATGAGFAYGLDRVVAFSARLFSRL